MKKCDPRAFARCPDKRACGNVVVAEFADGSDCDKFNQSILAHPITNADRIRAMSDEELCDFMIEDHPCDTEMPKNCTFDCPECIMKWLQQPAEEESNG